MSKIAIIFILIFIVGIVLIFVSTPVVSFYLYQIVYFFNPNDRWWSGDIPNISYSFIASFLMIITIILHNKNRPNISDSPIFKWIYLILLSYFLIYFVAIDQTLHLREAISLLKLVIIITIAYKLIDNLEKYKTTIWVYIFGCFYMGYEAFNMGRNSSGRLEGFGTVDAPDSNLLSSVIVPIAPFLIHFFWNTNIKQKALLIALSAFIINSLILLNSRGAFLGLISGSAYYMFYLFKGDTKIESKKGLVILTLTLGSVATLQLTDKIFWERMQTISEQKTDIKNEDLSGGSKRMIFWIKTFEMLEDHPLGLGAYGFEALSPLYLESSLLTGKGEIKVRSVHSSWFQSLGELGWPGPLLYLLTIISALSMTRKTKKLLNLKSDFENYYLIVATEAAFISYLITGLFINRFRGEIFYWLLLFIASSYWIFHQNTNSDKNIN